MTALMAKAPATPRGIPMRKLRREIFFVFLSISASPFGNLGFRYASETSVARKQL